MPPEARPTLKELLKSRRTGVDPTRNYDGNAAAKMSTKKKWAAIKEEYQRLCLQRPVDAPPPSLKLLAQQFGVSYNTIRERSSKDGWYAEIEGMLNVQSQAVDEKVREHHKEVMHLLGSDEINEEVAVRLRHAKTARVLQVRAMVRLSMLAPEELKPREAIDLMRLGMEMERKAIGLQDENTLAGAEQGRNPDVSTVSEAIDAQDKLRRLGIKLIEKIALLPDLTMNPPKDVTPALPGIFSKVDDKRKNNGHRGKLPEGFGGDRGAKRKNQKA